MCWISPSILSCPGHLSPVAMWCWSSSCLISVWHPTAFLLTTAVSPVVQSYHQMMWELSQGPPHQYLRLNPLNPNNLPPPHSHPPPLLNMNPLRKPDLCSHREAENGKTQERTGGCQSPDPMEMEGGLVGGTDRARSDWKMKIFCWLLSFSLVSQNPLCAKACKRDGTIKSSFCSSEFGKFLPAD